MQVLGRRYDTDELVEVTLDRGAIRAITPQERTAQHTPILAPALVDLQVNGYGGQEFSSAQLTTEKVAAITGAMSPLGVAKYLPTVTTNAQDVLLYAMQTLARACDEDPRLAYRIPGIHLEGPFISREEGARGAHPLRYCSPPDWPLFQQLQDAAGGRIRLVTLSPEYDEAPAFIRRAVESEVVVAIGHTAATSDQIRAAVDAGATLSTHLGNGAHRSLPRHPNYLWDQLAEDRLTASLICDGHHLPAAVVKTFVRAKTAGRCVLVSDLSGLAGVPPGRYASELCDLEILDDGRLVVAGQRQLLAGASAPIARGIATVMDYAGVSLQCAVEMASIAPARLIGLKHSYLEVGSSPDLVLLELQQSSARELHVRALIVGGELVSGSLTAK